MKFGKKSARLSKKEFDSNPVYNEKYMKIKIKFYDGKINANFHNIKIPKEGFQCICLSVILIDSVCKKDKNFYPQVFLEEYKYLIKEKQKTNFIADDINVSPHEENSDGIN